MYELKYDPAACEACDGTYCLTRCQYLDLDLDAARKEMMKILAGEDSMVLHQCATCYACEEYCPQDNHPFFLIVEQQEKLGIWPAPVPITNQQVRMMEPRGQLAPAKVSAPVIDMCFFPMLTGSIRGKIYEGASTIGGADLFCNIMWLHFAKNSVIRERLPLVIDNIMKFYLKDSGVEELVCYHDECYGTFTHLAPAFGIEVPFRPIHLFEFLVKRLTGLKSDITPLNATAAYQRPCSNRLIPETQHWVDEIFALIGVERPEREYDRENALCCAATIRAQQREELADDVQERNIEDMAATGAKYCVFNCPMCFFTLKDKAAARGMTPMLMSDLCRLALGEGLWG